MDIDRLEKLNRLRESGALTAEEFESEKQRLLQGASAPVSRMPPRPVLIGVLAALVIVGLIVFLLSRQTGSDIATAKLATDNAMEGPVATASDDTSMNVTEPVEIPERGYRWAVSTDILGKNPAYVEERLGTASEKSADNMSLKVDGCSVSYHIKKNAIDAINAEVSQRCQPIVNGRVITPRTTFANVDIDGGSLESGCISSCGNAYDPTVDLVFPGSHANMFIDVKYIGDIADPSSDTMDAWAKSIRLEHGIAEDDYADEDVTWFQCVSNPSEPVVAKARGIKIASVQIGQGLPGGSCAN